MTDLNLAKLLIASASITKQKLQEERIVSAAKWYEYRFMPAIEATLLFYNIYQDIYRRLWRANFDAEKSKFKIGTPKAGIWANSREFASVWRARQIVDGLGLPYDFFIQEASNAALRRGARRPPRPNQLYNERNVAVVADQWEERCRSVPVISVLPQYRIEAFCGLPSQEGHQAWVIANLKARHAKSFVIAQACFCQRVITLERVEAEFSPYQVEQVRYEGANMVAEPVEPLPASAFWPSCFGVPHARSAASSTCSACHAREACGVIEQRVREKLIERYGSDDPRGDEVRALGRERVRRHRAKAAEASS